MDTEQSDVFVLYDYNYDYRGKDVEIKQGEKLNLLQKTNQHWWKVSRPGVNKAFFVPAQYVEVIKTELQKGKIKKEEPSGTTTKIMTGSISSHPISIPSPKTEEGKQMLSSTSSSPKSITIKRTDSARTKKAAKLKNWSASLEELSKQIVFPGITTSVIDLTEKSHNKPVPLPRSAPPISFSNPGFNGGLDDDSPVSTESLGALPSIVPPVPKSRYKGDTDSGTSTEDILENKESPPRRLAAASSSSSCNETPPSNQMKSDNKSPIFPLAPSKSQKPLRTLSNNWAEFRDEKLKRFYYYNDATGQTSWKPPRNSSSRSFIGDSYESLDNSLTGDEGPILGKCDSRGSIGIATGTKPDPGPGGTPTTFHIPEGWIETFDEVTGQICYVNVTGARWFTSQDPQGKIYFYEENSSKSSWFLPGAQPEVEEVPNDCQQGQTKVPSANSPPKSSGAPSEALDHFSVKKRHSTGDMTDRYQKSRSLLLHAENRRIPGDKSSSLPRSRSIWINRDELNILKEGPLNRTKIMENGKKLRKNWAPVISVLSDSHLSLFKDQKMRNCGKSEIEIELRGSTLEWTFDGDKSRRKNVFQLTNRFFQILFQAEDIEVATEWFNTLNEHTDTQPEFLLSLRSGSPDDRLDLMPCESNTKKRLGRNKSTKYKISGASGSYEEIPSDVDMSSIRAHLKKFFHRRPPRESLVKKGIYKDESVFGCNLEKLCQLEKSSIPRFVAECIATIERGDNLKTDGIYRASGNLSQVQKIRLQVDQNNMEPVSKEEDVHVLAGALKLFFREMREPLISCDLFERSLKACNIPKKEQKIREFREIISELPQANKATLQALLKHLLKVSEHSDFNRMQIPNLAIVFGPTLMWPEKESTNMALDLMQQNLVVEALLLEHDAIFK